MPLQSLPPLIGGLAVDVAAGITNTLLRSGNVLPTDSDIRRGHAFCPGSLNRRRADAIPDGPAVSTSHDISVVDRACQNDVGLVVSPPLVSERDARTLERPSCVR